MLGEHSHLSNCGGAHKADDLACPKRKRYLPVTPKERQAAQPAAEASTSAPAAGPSGQRSGTPSVRFELVEKDNASNPIITQMEVEETS